MVTGCQVPGKLDRRPSLTPGRSQHSQTELVSFGTVRAEIVYARLEREIDATAATASYAPARLLPPLDESRIHRLHPRITRL